MSIKKKIKEKLMYLYLYTVSLLNNGKKNKMVFLVDRVQAGFASDLRGDSLASELRKLGWGTIVIDDCLNIEKAKKIVKMFNPEYIYMQKLRGKNNDITQFREYKCILDVDDADFLDERLIAKFKNTAEKAFMCFAGSEYVENWLKQYNNNTYIIWTGVKPTNNIKKIKNIPVISWACSDPFAYRVEADFVKKVIIKLKAKRKFLFYLIGVRDLEQGKNWLEEIDSNLVDLKQFPFMKYSKLNKLMQEVDIGLAPLFPKENMFSSGKSFGKVLAYLNNKAVVVASDCLEHSKFFNGENGFLCSDDVENWVVKMEELLDNRAELCKIADKAKASFIEKLSIVAIAKKVDDILRIKK